MSQENNDYENNENDEEEEYVVHLDKEEIELSNYFGEENFGIYLGVKYLCVEENVLKIKNFYISIKNEKLHGDFYFLQNPIKILLFFIEKKGNYKFLEMVGKIGKICKVGNSYFRELDENVVEKEYSESEKEEYEKIRKEFFENIEEYCSLIKCNKEKKFNEEEIKDKDEKCFICLKNEEENKLYKLNIECGCKQIICEECFDENYCCTKHFKCTICRKEKIIKRLEDYLIEKMSFKPVDFYLPITND